MEPFNIKISIAENAITLTILPTSSYYKVIYFGGILGAISLNCQHWELVPPAEVKVGDLPPYSNNFGEIREEIVLDQENIQKIGIEIAKSHSIQD